MARIEGLDQLIIEHPFFEGMDSSACETIAGCAKNERFDAGDYVFREGEGANKFYLIRHGSVALEIRVPGRDPIVVDTLHGGEILGWSWLVAPYKWINDARATRLVRAVSLDAACLRGKYENDHTLAYELFKRFIPVMARRMEAGRLRFIDMYR
jgi:CRP-like cAMP-binding protein